MTIKISHSAKDKFITCPRKYFYHYIEKLRSPKVGSALFFGNALDDAFSRLLLDKKPEKTEQETKQLELSPEEIFAARMLETRNEAGQIVQIAQSPLADYYSSDFDASLLTNEDVSLVSQVDKNINTIQKITKFHEDCKYHLNYRNKDRRKLTDEEYILYNYINWLSLNQKGKLMLDAYRDNILPEISTVFNIQKEIAIKEPDTGDLIQGKIDVIASFKDKPDVPYICDNKTSSKPYPEDAVKTSEQLATYAEAEGNFNGAYLVVQKQVFKKEPKIRTQIIKDTIPEQILGKTFDIYGEIVHNISAAGDDIDNYPKNMDSCFDFGKLCPYYSICKHNNYDNNLISCKKPKEEGNNGE